MIIVNVIEDLNSKKKEMQLNVLGISTIRLDLS